MRLVDIDDERLWDILFNEACVEGQQAERIDKELENIICYNVDKVVEKVRNIPHGQILNVELESEIIEIVKAGGNEDW